MGFVGNYAPCGLPPQTGGMPVIPKKEPGLLPALKNRISPSPSEGTAVKLQQRQEKVYHSPGTV